jgi:hypothetical protein
VSLLPGALGLFGAAGATGGPPEKPPLPEGFVDAGILHLETGWRDKFWWEGAGGGLRGIQNIGDNKCVLKLTGPQTLASVSAGSQQPGFVDNSIGVFSGGSKGTPCGRVSAGEQPLTVKLAGLLDPLSIIRAALDVEVKGNAVVQADLFLDGAPAGQFILRSGRSIVGGQGSHTPGSPIFNCSAKSDSGPDAGPLDNCKWRFDGLFDEIRLTALTGEFSLEGGADGWIDESRFYLAERQVPPPTGTVNCPGQGDNNFVPQDPEGTAVLTGSRQQDAGNPGACEPIDYDLTFDGKEANFVKRGAGVPNATFLFDITFNAEPGSGGNPLSIPPTRFEFDAAPGTLFELAGCKGTPQFDEAGNFIGISDILTAGLDLLPKVDGVQYSCAFDQRVKVVGPNAVQVTQGIYLIGDWRSFR